ncbi:LETM1 domain-containing protein 1 isoform X1 [Python bivittatus]|uniref:LETM1 domain-containing protein 1 isoform X1 n=1 Tax=Python bivittatus TaxID=176946 RepID=A0A9F2QTJ5_PYTBI|nr:LETM1 domain-containing protein 1 isoform X1 [Python bivittatus]
MALLLVLLSGRRCYCYCSSGGCGLRLGLCRTSVPAASLYRALRPSEPPPWPALRLPVCHFSSKANSKKLTSVLVSKVKCLNKKYERYLERTFPRFYQLYSTFLKGLQVFFSEAKEIRRIKANMSHKNIQFHQLPYREMERLRQFRRDLIKAIPVGILSLPPFANYFVLLFMYLFPRQLLVRHFWTPKQQAEFLNTYHNMRREAYAEVIDGLMHLSHFLDDPQLRQQMLYLCRKVQEGFHPDVTELKAVRTLFVGHPFGIQQLTVQHVKVLSRVLFLTPRLPSFFLRNRLRSHLSELHHLDQAMVKLGVSELTDEEVQVACYTRGLNSVHLSPSACRLWLNQWLSLSSSLRDSETSLLAHAMVLLSTNFTLSSKS